MTAPVLSGTGAAHATGTGAAHATHRGNERIPTCVEIGYDNPATTGKPNGQWIDVTSDTRALSTTRGRQQELQRFEAGTLTCKLDNRSGNYSRWIGMGVNIGCPIRVRISAEKSSPTGASPALDDYDPTDGGFFYVWHGFIESMDYDWSPGGNSDGWVTITAVDAFALLNKADLVGAVFTSGGSATGVADPVEVPQFHDGGNVEIRVSAATFLVHAIAREGQVVITNNGPNTIFLGDNTVTTTAAQLRGPGMHTFPEAEWVSANGISVASGQSYVLTTPTAGVWGIAAVADQVSPADTRWDFALGVQYGHDRLVQVVDQSGVKPLLDGLYIKYEDTGPNDFGAGAFYAPYAPVVDSGAGSPVTANALAHLQEIAEAAFIDLYVRPDGVICWRPYSEVRSDAFDGVTIFGDNTPTEMAYTAVGPIYDNQNLYNDVNITLQDGTVSSSNNAASIAAYGRRAMPPKTVPVWPLTIGVGAPPSTFVPSRFAPASDYVTRYKDPLVRVPSIAVSLRGLTDAQRMRVLSLPIGYRVQVKRRPPGGDDLTAECHFEGVSLTWEPGMMDVKAVLNLAPVRAPGSFVLG